MQKKTTSEGEKKAAALPAGVASVRRAKDFAETGEYEVALASGAAFRIYRDTLQFSFAIWYVVDVEGLTGLTKAGILELLVKRFGSPAALSAAAEGAVDALLDDGACGTEEAARELVARAEVATAASAELLAFRFNAVRDDSSSAANRTLAGKVFAAMWARANWASRKAVPELAPEVAAEEPPPVAEPARERTIEELDEFGPRGAGGYEDAPATKMLATRCACCARPLVDAASVEAGVGPDCREKHGYGEAQGEPDWPAVLAATDGLVSVEELLGARGKSARAHVDAANALNALDAAWRLGGVDTCRVANLLVHRVACDQDGPAVLPLVNAVRALGFGRLAARIAQRLAAVHVEVDGDSISVEAPYSPEAADVLRGVRRAVGGRWDVDRKRNVFPLRARRHVFEALRRAYPGATVTGPKGLFVLS